MPQLKQPMRLEEACIWLHILKYRGKCEKWLHDLHVAAKGDKDAYVVAFDTVMEECREMKEEISTLPPKILKLLSPSLAKIFAIVICTDGYLNDCLLNKPWVGGTHVNLCKTVFHSVLTRYTEKLSTRTISVEYVRDLMVENLNSVPGLLKLYINKNHFDRPGLLPDMIRHLKNLQIFKYHRYCTDRIIAQLQRHCPHLTKLDVAHSREVTNASVKPLREAKKLQVLNLEGTQIDYEHYGLLLSELPKITNIIFWLNGDLVLRHIPVKRLDTITHIKGYCQDINALTHKCPNTTSIATCPPTRDLSGLTAFNVLRSLYIQDLDYGSSNVKAVLQGVGHRLTDLKLDHIVNVDLQDVTTLCPSLENLSLMHCLILHLTSNTPFHNQLPHFRKLINLEIGCLIGRPNVGSYIRHYFNLKSIRLMKTSSFTVELVTEISNIGTYKQLEILCVNEHWREDIDVKALELLIQHCALLKRIELVGSSLERDVFGELKGEILLQNFDLKFSEYDEVL
jgi:hypothetical protein